MPINKLSESRELLREFQDSQTRTERTRALTAIATGAILYLLFIFIDRSFYPDQAATLLLIRAVAVSCMVIGIVLVARAKTYWGQVIPSALTWVVGAGAIGVMCHATEGFSSPYWAGIPLCGVAATIFTWPPRIAAASFGLGLLPYYAPLFQRGVEVDLRLLMLTSAFIFGTYFLALLGIQIHKRLAFRAFLSHRELERSHAELAELDRNKNRMFQNVSHELRTPLTLMLGPLERRIRGQSDFGVNREGVETLHRHGLRLLKLINDLLDLAQLTTEDLPVARKTIDLRRFVQTLVEDARVAAEASNVELTADLPPSPILYSVDTKHLEGILLNLLSNAIKFTEPGGKIRVLFESGIRTLRISVFDDGRGIEEADQERIFERFEQAQGTSDRTVGGAGIGLALVRELVELLEGTVSVTSTMGEGSCFTIALPTRYMQARQANPPPNPPARDQELDQQALLATLHRSTAPERIVCGRRGARILIAEDDPDLRLQLAEMLQDRYRVVAVSNGVSALSEALEFLPHLVITDVMMPGIDGIELCRRLRQHLEFHRTAVLMLTARSTLNDRVNGRSAGADTYLTKPFATQELLSAVQGLLKARMHIVGDFLLHQRLGHGGQSSVFMAEHLRSGQPAAVKLIAVNKKQTAEQQAQTRREVRALVHLDHPNIVKILAEYEHAGEFFLAMEYLAGISVHTYLKQAGSLPIGEAAAIAQGIARALDHAHEHGLVHRDVKCSNVILTSEDGPIANRVKLIDFGSATLLGVEPRDPQGTPAYMAPELLGGRQDASIRSDIYGVGVMLFRMCLGHLPLDSHQLELLRRRELSPQVWTDLVSDSPAEIQCVLERALTFEPASRWPSARTMAEALDPLADKRSGIGSIGPEPQGRLLTPTHPITPFESDSVNRVSQ